MTEDTLAKARSVNVGQGGKGLMGLGIILILLGAVLTFMLFKADNSNSRFGYAYLWGYTWVWALVLGSMFFVILHHLSGAVWSVVLRRVAEMFAHPVCILILAVLFIPIIMIGKSHDMHLFHWMHVLPGEDSVLDLKAEYLNVGFFNGRAIGFLLLWFVLGIVFVTKSLQQDEMQATEAVTAKLRTWAPLAMITFALTITFASFDWLMSLEPHWFSTIFGAYIFAGMILTSLSVIVIMIVWLRSKGQLGNGIVTNEHLYSIGLLMFAFTCFWAYMWFSQFMLIWYGNIPEETIWFTNRGWGPDGNANWTNMTWAIMIIRFVIPFFLLISRHAKMGPKRLVFAGCFILFGQFLDLYWLIMPSHGSFYMDKPLFNFQDLGPAFLMIGLIGCFAAWFLNKYRMVAVGDPLFEKSCHFHL